MVDIESKKFDCAVAHELTGYGHSPEQHSGADEKPIVGASWNGRRQSGESRSELLDYGHQFDGFEVDP